jgi:hypothetical protein
MPDYLLHIQVKPEAERLAVVTTRKIKTGYCLRSSEARYSLCG